MPHSLLSILLTASSSGRQHIVFAYPANPQTLPRTSRPTYGQSFALADRRHGLDETVASPVNGYSRAPAQDDELGDQQGTPPLFGENSWLSKPKAKDPHAEPTYEYLGLRGDLLADLLLPRHRGLYNKKLEVVVNHLAFIGHPVFLDKPSNTNDTSPEKSRRPTVTSQPSASDSSSQVTSPASMSSRAMDSQASSQYFGLDSSTSSTPERPVWTPNASTTSRTSQSTTRLDRFSVTLVIDTPPDKKLSRQLDVYYRDIVVKLTAALKGEERRNGWLTSEVTRCRAIRTESKSGQTEALTSKLVSSSPLCAALAAVFDSLVDGKVAHIEALNGNLDLSLLLHDELLDERPLEGYRDAGIVEQYNPLRPVVPVYDRDGDDLAQQLAPWHTLLPLEDIEGMLENLEPGLVYDFVERLNAKKPLLDYELELDIDDESVREIVQHLVYWRKVRVVSAVSVSKQVVPHPTIDMRKLPGLTQAFASRFSTLGSLPVILSTLPSSPTFRKALPPHADKTTAYDALIWLLRHDLVAQLHTYVRVVATPAVRRASFRAAAARQQILPPSSSITTKLSTSASSTMGNSASSAEGESLSGRTPDSFPAVDEDERYDTEDRASSVINEPARPSTVERRWLEQIVRGRDEEVVEHFQRMLPMLNGRFHLEAIAHHTSLSIREIKAILETFGDAVVTFAS